MAEIVNLRREKKRRARADEAARAQENRVLHGRTKGQVTREAVRRAAQHRQLDGAKLSKPGDDDLS